MFNPGETIIHQFVIPFLSTELSKVIVSYKQGDDIVLEKTVTSGFTPIEEYTKTQFAVTLSQEESLMFSDLNSYTIQLNVLTIFGTRAASKEIRGTSGVQHHREVIST